MSWRAAAAAAGLVMVSLATTSCLAQLSAPRVIVQITPLDRLAASPDRAAAGEVILEVRNQSAASHLMEIARLTAGTSALPVVGGQVADGGDAKPTFDGEGYTIVAKLDLLKPHRPGRDAPSQVVHQYFRAGSYVLFDNQPGGYSSGHHLTFRVT